MVIDFFGWHSIYKMFNHPFYTVNPLLSPPGANVFQALLRGGGGLKKRAGGLI